MRRQTRLRAWCWFSLGVWLLAQPGPAESAVYPAPSGGGVNGQPSSSDFLFQLADEYRRAGQVENAIHELRKLLLINPTHEEARRVLTELERARREQAIQEAVRQTRYALTPREEAIEAALRRAGAPVTVVAQPPPAPSEHPVAETRVVPPRTPRPSSQQEGIVKRLNDSMAPLVISGEYRAMAGVRRDDFVLQDANGDLSERNFRVLFGPYRYNTYDPRIFNRFRLNIDTPDRPGWQLHSNTTVDPWSFVGTTDRVTVVGATPTDSVEVKLKWWSGTNTAINETFNTLRNGDSIATPEIETAEGRTLATAVTSTFGNTFTIPSLKIDYTFQPIRWFWTGYKSDTVDFRVFPLALENQAISSDDPLALSNHHIYWEPSPWLDEWIPGRRNVGASPVDFTRGRWSDDLSFFTRDSDLSRLTALRGTSVRWQLTDSTTLDSAWASPKGLWEDYGNFSNFLGMARLKQTFLEDRLSIGGLYTTRWGYRERHRDATNHVYSMDAAWTPVEGTTLSLQGAASQTIEDRTQIEHDFGGWAWHGSLKSAWWGEHLTSRLFYTHMDEGFDPGLASYRQTRDDRFWGRHISFKRRLRLIDAIHHYSSVTSEELNAVRIGDGVDVGRDAFGLRLAGSWWQERFQPLVDVRNVHTTEGKYVETVIREENSIKPIPWFTLKTLFLYHDLPDTIAGIDPFLVDADTNKSLINALVRDGRNPSLQTYSVGGEIAPAEHLSVWAAWERTNDSTVATGNFPRGLLNSSSFATATELGNVIRSTSPFLYGQGFFPQAPYPFFDIYRAGVYYSPTDSLELAWDWTRNEFEHAGQINDNLNHIGFTAAWSPVARLTLIGRYVASWAIDVTRENAGEGAKFTAHQNLYGDLRWKVSADAEFDLEYGVAAFALPNAVVSYDPTGDFYLTLDTQHLLRILYTVTF